MVVMTNAQVALMAAVEASKNMKYMRIETHRVIADAKEYLAWLEDNS